VKTTIENELWKCPKCGRRFARMNQAHSCKIFSLEKHFEGRDKGRYLYEKLMPFLTRNVGPFAVDSVECCIHLVANTTFAAIKVLRGKIRIEFALSRLVKTPRLKVAEIQPSSHNYLYFADLDKVSEIDEELLGWINQAYEEKNNSSHKGNKKMVMNKMAK
jgi:hypothetical protein